MQGRRSGELAADERALLERLADLIIPRDGASPGAADVDVVAVLQQKLARDPLHRGRYARGLSDYDALARRRHGRRFVALSESDQLRLLEQVERLSLPGTGIVPRVRRVFRTVRVPAAHLFPVLVQDVFEAFYTSPAAWRWLEYDGPPMPLGYPDVRRRRL